MLSIIVWIMHMHNAWQLPQGRIWRLCSCPGHGLYMVVKTGMIKWWHIRQWPYIHQPFFLQQNPSWPSHCLMWSTQQCAPALFTMVCSQQNWESALKIRLDVEGGIWLLAFYPHPCFITANKGGLHWGLSSRLGLLSHTTCMEQPAIHMQIWPRQD